MLRGYAYLFDVRVVECVCMGGYIRIMWDANRTMVDLEQHTQPSGSTAVFQGSPA